MLAPAVYCLSRSRRLAPAHQSSPPIGIQVFAPTIRTDERTQPRARTATLLDTFQRVLALGARKVAPPDVKARWQIERSDIDRALGGGRKRRSRHGESHRIEQQPCPARRSPSAADFLRFSTDLDFGQGVRTANRLTTGQPLSRPPLITWFPAQLGARGQTVRRPLTSPRSHSTNRITAIVKSIFFPSCRLLSTRRADPRCGFNHHEISGLTKN